ncbi:MAG: DNA-3-methyladenine glycosylase I [Treponema sp.]|jgi:DNA-3-methyladenine glycosylase I|nr:DNA-3-methyladenine glycosylase I [Treponema sp.]
MVADSFKVYKSFGEEERLMYSPVIRCPWCLGDELYIKYHDEEWGRPLREDQKLFELLILEGAQAGLSWLTILKRREGYRKAFSGMRPEKIARYGEKDVERLMGDSRIIRNRLKILSAVQNARAYCAMMEGPAGFSQWLWDWVDGEPRINRFSTTQEVPASTALSQEISRALKKRGFTFAGPVIMYSFLQAAGLVNDHLLNCWRRSGQAG